MDDDPLEKETSLFLVLCDKKFERLYALQFADVSEDCSIEFRFVNSPKLFTLQCLQNAPTAGLVDLATLIRGKTEDMNRLFDFRSVWPVLRSRIGSDGSGEIMRVDPPLKGNFQETIAQLAEGGSVWLNSEESREQLRCGVRCRARWRVAGSEGEWNHVNIETLARNGCAIVASDPPRNGTPLELEILDLPGGSAVLNGSVAWVRQWEDSVEIPRCGVKFSQESIPETLLEALGDPSFVRLP